MLEIQALEGLKQKFSDNLIKIINNQTKTYIRKV